MVNDRMRSGTFSRPCLVDMDTQVDFVMPDGALYVPGAEQLIPIWRELTTLGESNGLPMIASVDAHAADDPEFARLPPHCVAGTPGRRKVDGTLSEKHQFVPNEAGDATIDFDSQLILEKQNVDVFTNVHAAEVFGMMRMRCSTFVVYGVTTECAVRTAVLGLLDRGYRVHVLSDAIQAIDEAAGERALTEMANAGAAFTNSATLFDKVRQHLANRVM